MDNNQNLTDSITNNLDQETAAIAQCLKDYLNVHWRTAQHYQILRFLADETLQRLSEGKQTDSRTRSDHCILVTVLSQ